MTVQFMTIQTNTASVVVIILMITGSDFQQEHRLFLQSYVYRMYRK